jgi:putative transposase
VSLDGYEIVMTADGSAEHRNIGFSLLARALLPRVGVSSPRRVIPGAVYLVTRRCCQRTFRLRPTAETSHILAYCLAVALEKTGVLLHAVCFMSNHHHMVVADPRGELPNFLRELHRMTAKAMNASQGQWENLWSAEPCSAVRLADDEDVIDKIAYVAVNPVAAGLVEKPQEWPGLSMWTEGVVTLGQPNAYFRAGGECPAKVSLRVSVPPSVRQAGGCARRVQSAVAVKVVQAHRRMRAAGRAFVGRAAVLAQSFVQRAKSFEPKRAVVPTVAAKNPKARRALLAIQKAFRVAYRQALDAWKAGGRESVFPFGTWWMRVHHRVQTEPQPSTG